VKIIKVELHGLVFRCFIKLEMFNNNGSHKFSVVQIDRVQSKFGDVHLKHDTDFIARESIVRELNLNADKVISLFDQEEIDNYY